MTTHCVRSFTSDVLRARDSNSSTGRAAELDDSDDFDELEGYMGPARIALIGDAGPVR